MNGLAVDVKGFKAVGMTYFGDNNNGEIPDLWKAFNSQFNNVKDKSIPMLFYGICDSDMDEENRFNYCACIKVDSYTDVPENMVTKNVPDGKYLVYTYAGEIKDLGSFYDKIFMELMPKSGYSIDERPQLELYDERFMKTGEFDIYIPVK